jgi:hypothetical protein
MLKSKGVINAQIATKSVGKQSIHFKKKTVETTSADISEAIFCFFSPIYFYSVTT